MKRSILLQYQKLKNNKNMGFFDKKPIIQNKVEPPKKQEAKPHRTDPMRNDWFRGRSQVPKNEIDRYFRDPKVRFDLKRKLNISTEQKLDEEIKDMKKMIVNRFGTGAVDMGEVKRSIREEYWNAKHDIEEKRKGGLAVEESKEIKRREEELKFLKEKFGIK